jgi:hypothetical protein
MPQELAYFNGIDGTTGDYLVPPMAPATLARIARGETWGGKDRLSELKFRDEQRKVGRYALEPGRDPKKLGESGWGLILPAGADRKLADAILDALAPLRDLRRGQAGDLYKEYVGPRGYQAGESKDDFLKRNGAGPGQVDPTRVPYYLLLVADPESIPFRVQYELDVAYAVGRIYFPMLDGYARYAAAVVAAESGKVVRPRKAVFFGVANPEDPATGMSSKLLIPPLAEEMAKPGGGAAPAAWTVETIPPAQTVKAKLRSLLGNDAPALLFTASHGMGFPNGDPRQMPFQGALLCQDWPGPAGGRGEVKRDHYLGAEDVGAEVGPVGTLAFFFACYGAGTPYWDDFAKQAFRTRAAIAPRAFLAALPMALLGHPKGGALAVVGHIERAWGYSIQWGGGVDQTGAFRGALRQLKDGHPIGSALEGLNARYAEIAVMLSNSLEQAEYEPVDSFELAGQWTANNDARGYAILGDPAVRLAVPAAGVAAPARPDAIEVKPRGGDPLPNVLAPGPAPGPARVATAGTRFDTGTGRPADPGAVAMGLPGADLLRGIRDGLAGALKQFADRLSAFVSDMASLEVSTFVADNLDQVTFDSATGRFTAGARLRALTRIGLDGDMQTCVPQADGQVDRALWDVHQGTVHEAQAHRTAMIRTVADLLTGLVRPGAGG